MTEAGSGGPRPTIDTTVRVMTWNLWWRFGPWQQRQPAIIETLRRVEPDLVALQEVWHDGETGQADGLAAALSFHSVFDSRFSIDELRFGNAVLSRWPISGRETHEYEIAGEHDAGRHVLRADIDGPRGALQIYCTHLSWRHDHSHLRQGQVAELARFVADSRPRDHPEIVCGDFNAEPDSEEIRMLTGRTTVPVEGVVFNDAWGPKPAGMTWDNNNPFAAAGFDVDRRIDYVFTGWPRAGGAGHVTRCHLAGTEPVDGVWPSDHLAVVADIRY